MLNIYPSHSIYISLKILNWLFEVNSILHIFLNFGIIKGIFFTKKQEENVTRRHGGRCSFRWPTSRFQVRVSEFRVFCDALKTVSAKAGKTAGECSVIAWMRPQMLNQIPLLLRQVSASRLRARKRRALRIYKPRSSTLSTRNSWWRLFCPFFKHFQTRLAGNFLKNIKSINQHLFL